MREKLGLTDLTNEVSLSVVKKMGEPVLLTRTASVSGKLYLAAQLERYYMLGQDAVAVTVNDMLAEAARPLLFYDMISCARPKASYLQELEDGAMKQCKRANVRYVGSEIKELPEIISYDQYDMVGFLAGVKDKRKEDTELAFAEGDVILGLASDGLHNNGYVLARKKLYLTKSSMEVYYETLGSNLGELLMQPTRMYQSALESVYESGLAVKAVTQVKHGGIDQAVRKMLKQNVGAVIKQRLEDLPPLYHMIHRDGNISMEQMRENFNMGVGMLLVVSEEDAQAVTDILEKAGENVIHLGLVEKDTFAIRYIN